MRTLFVVLLALNLGGCKSGKGGVDGDDDDSSGRTDLDGRLITDVKTWDCADPATGLAYQGVFGQSITLEYAPNGVSVFPLPAPGGCTAGLDMFPADAGSRAADIPDLNGDPRWESEVDSGELKPMATGFWSDEVFEQVHQCQDVEELLGGGTALTEAGALNGAVTPTPAELPKVTYEGRTTITDDDGQVLGETIEWGDEFTATWEDHEWDEVWVQVRREREGEAWESVTCNATGQSSFTLDTTIWHLMDESLEVEQNNLYVAFQKTADVETDGGQKVRGMIRSMAVAIVKE